MSAFLVIVVPLDPELLAGEQLGKHLWHLGCALIRRKLYSKALTVLEQAQRALNSKTDSYVGRCNREIAVLYLAANEFHLAAGQAAMGRLKSSDNKLKSSNWLIEGASALIEQNNRLAKMCFEKATELNPEEKETIEAFQTKWKDYISETGYDAKVAKIGSGFFQLWNAYMRDQRTTTMEALDGMDFVIDRLAFIAEISGSAFQNWKNVKEKEPASDKEIAELYGIVANSYAHRQSRDLDESIEYYSKALEWNPLDLLYLRERAVVYMRCGRVEAAFRDIDSALELDPRDALSNARKGYILMFNKQVKQADDYFRLAIDLSGQNPEQKEIILRWRFEVIKLLKLDDEMDVPIKLDGMQWSVPQMAALPEPPRVTEVKDNDE